MASLYSRGSGGPAPAPALRAAVLAALAVAAAWSPGCGSSPGRPNVLLVVVSGLRADHASSYGYGRATTPALDALAGEGTLYEQAIATAPWSISSQASILTGLYPSEHGASFDRPVLEPGLETLAERLEAEGFDTLAVSADAELGRHNGFGQGFDQFVEMRPAEAGSPDDGAAGAESAFLDWLDKREGAGRAPFFAWMTLVNPRLSFNPPEEYQQKFLEVPIALPRLTQLAQLWIPFARRYSFGAVELPPDELAALVSLYDGEVAYADYRLGRLIAALKQRGLLDSTLVVVTADGGEDLGEHGLLADASSVYDTLVRVPLVMRLPGRVAPGRREAGQVQTLDLPDAIVQLVAAEESQAPRQAGEGSMLRERPTAIVEAPFDPAAIVYYERIAPGADLSIFRRSLIAVRTPRFKYILNSLGSHALFDLAADPGETTSVTSQRADTVAAMQADLQRWTRALRPPAGGRATAPGGPGGANPPDPQAGEPGRATGAAPR